MYQLQVITIQLRVIFPFYTALTVCRFFFSHPLVLFDSLVFKTIVSPYFVQNNWFWELALKTKHKTLYMSVLFQRDVATLYIFFPNWNWQLTNLYFKSWKNLCHLHRKSMNPSMNILRCQNKLSTTQISCKKGLEYV